MKTIYSHPEEIKRISKKLNNHTLIAFIMGDYDYHLFEGKYYSIFQPGLGDYPEEIQKTDIRKDAVYINQII